MIKKKVLVTGGAGFVGSHLCDRLLAEGNEVICMDNYFDHPLFIYNDDDDDEIKPQNIKDKYPKFFNYLINSNSVLNTVLNT